VRNPHGFGPLRAQTNPFISRTCHPKARDHKQFHRPRQIDNKPEYSSSVPFDIGAAAFEDEQGRLPRGWERRENASGRSYYVDHDTRPTYNLDRTRSARPSGDGAGDLRESIGERYSAHSSS
jgi:hypothetical protein